MTPLPRPLLSVPGFRLENTGGNCTALTRRLCHDSRCLELYAVSPGRAVAPSGFPVELFALAYDGERQLDDGRSFLLSSPRALRARLRALRKEVRA